MVIETEVEYQLAIKKFFQCQGIRQPQRADRRERGSGLRAGGGGGGRVRVAAALPRAAGGAVRAAGAAAGLANRRALRVQVSTA